MSKPSSLVSSMENHTSSTWKLRMLKAAEQETRDNNNNNTFGNKTILCVFHIVYGVLFDICITGLYFGLLLHGLCRKINRSMHVSMKLFVWSLISCNIFSTRLRIKVDLCLCNESKQFVFSTIIFYGVMLLKY